MTIGLDIMFMITIIIICKKMEDAVDTKSIVKMVCIIIIVFVLYFIIKI